MLFATTPTNPINGRELLANEQGRLRLGLDSHPLGPPADPGLVQAAEVYDAILTSKPYPVRAAVLFGTDPLLGHGDPLRGKAALEALDFYVHVDTTLNPSAHFADLILPATTCWEREALLPFCEIAEDTMNWAQLRPAVAKAVGESRSEAEIVFDLAKRLDLTEHFFDGNIEAALAYQLAPSGLTTEQLRANPIGMRASVSTRHRKYAEIDTVTGQAKGFNTPTGKIEIYSTAFANAGYPPIPHFESNDPENTNYPLTLTFYRDIHFCDQQHRNIPRLRRVLPEPFVEIHPSTAMAKGIAEGEWMILETATGKVKLKAKVQRFIKPACRRHRLRLVAGLPRTKAQRPRSVQCERRECKSFDSEQRPRSDQCVSRASWPTMSSDQAIADSVERMLGKAARELGERVDAFDLAAKILAFWKISH